MNFQAGSTRDAFGLARLQELSDVHLRAGNLDQAAQLLQQILQAAPKNAAAYSSLAVIAQARNDPEAAVGLAREAARLAPKSAHCLATLGRVLRAAGRAEEAVAAYRRALKVEPARADIQVSLGIALRAAGSLDEAETAYRRAAALAPTMAEAHHNLGNLLIQRDRHDDAEACHRRALELNPRLAEAWYELGNQATRRKDLPEATACYRKAVACAPAYGKAWFALGESLARGGEDDEALAAFRKAAECQPDNAEAHFHVGYMLRARKDHAAASLAFRTGLAIDSEHVQALCNLSEVLRNLGERQEALACAQRALQIDPEAAQANFSIGLIMLDLDQHALAIAALERVVELLPAMAPAYANLCGANKRFGQLEKALAYAYKTLEIDPLLPEGHINLGGTLLDFARADEAILHYRRAIEIRPDHPAAIAGLCMTINYVDRADRAAVFAPHREYGERLARPLASAALPHANDRDPGRRLRVGYVSPDFRAHSVAWFIDPVLRAHDHGAIEIVGYHNHAISDAVTARIKSRCDQWVDVIGLSDEGFAQRVRDDRIDILVDLAGHTAGNRLEAFARKPAPVQMSWLGYLTSTGVEAIDWRITDHRVDQPGAEQWQVEKPLRLPACYVCYGPPAEAPAVGPLPDGPITFGSFNNLAKMSPRTIALWSAVLKAVPGSRLRVKTRPLVDAAVRASLHERFVAQGIDEERLDLLGWEAGTGDHLAQYNRIHVALDTWPYNGVTTTCEALWMGVPVVSLIGENHASRQGLTLLSAVGLPDLATGSDAEFVARAAALALDRPGLAELRAGMRTRMAASELCDAPRAARDIETAYRQAWHAWCAGDKEATSAGL